MAALIIALFLSYLLGSIPFSFIIARLTGGIDIRRYGSGNIGATNVLRTVGKIPAFSALILDILKGVVTVTLLSKFFYRYGVNIGYESFGILMGLAVICGHIWTVFLKFKGGKGVATSAGVLLFLCPEALAVAAVVWLITVILTRFVSLGSIIGSISLPIAAAIMGKSLQMVIFTITLCLISSYKHKTNIIRLINREEPKIVNK